MNIKNTRAIVIGFFLFAIIFFAYSDSIIQFINTLHPLVGLILITLLNPIYLVVIWSLFKDYGVKGLLAGFIITIATDAISLPHFLTSTGQHTTAAINLVTELTFWNVIPEWLKTTTVSLPFLGQVNLAAFLIYVILTTLLIIVALMIVHKRKFKDIFWRTA